MDGVPLVLFTQQKAISLGYKKKYIKLHCGWCTSSTIHTAKGCHFRLYVKLHCGWCTPNTIHTAKGCHFRLYIKLHCACCTPSTTTTTTRSTSVDPPWISFSSQPCHPSLLASSLWGPWCPPPAHRQNVGGCPPTLLLPCFSSHKTKSLTTLFLLLRSNKGGLSVMETGNDIF